VHLFYLAWSVFFAIPPLPVLQSHYDKIAITHMFVLCNCVFFAIAAHQRFATTLSRMFAITCIFTKLQPHQAKTNLVTSSFLPVFLQSQSHCYKGVITLRQDLQSTTFWFATVFFLQSQHISRCKHTAKDVAITSNLTRLQPIKQRPP
jgi:hypothetical protein